MEENEVLENTATFAVAASTAVTAASASKRTLIRATPTQIKTLLDAFEKTPVTNLALLEQLEKETGLTKKWISSWFMRQRKKTQQASAAKAATTSTEVGASTATEQSGDASTLEVKKEVCEGVIAAPVPAPKKKRQRKSAPGSDGASSTSAATKKRKVDAADGPTAGETSSTTATAKPSVSIFDKLKVKVERYTPGPEERLANNRSTLATILNFGPYAPPPLPDPRLDTNASEHGLSHSAPVTGFVQAQPIAQSSSAPVPASSTATEKHGDSAQARRASSPSAIAMKSRRQRVQYAGEGPVMNTRFMHHGFTNAPLESRPGLPSPSMPSPMGAYQEGTDNYEFGLGPAIFPSQTGAVAPPLPNRIARAQRSDVEQMTAVNGATPPPSKTKHCHGATSADSSEGQRQDHHFPVLVNEVDTFDFQTNAASYQTGATALPMHERPMNIRDLFTNPSLGHPQHTDFLDPLHAPLKHLTEILDPICPPTLGRGGYEALRDLEGRQRQVVMEKLLDEDLGVNDPFRAAMGLVLASKMGLQWE
ncbi:hypothetical protein H1R20_g2600, partial [Candolleomyces eurysporus]